MKKIAASSFLVLLLSGCASFLGVGEGALRLNGNVYDSAGMPVQGATVELLIDGRPSRFIPPVSTDVMGHFAFDTLTQPSNFKLDLIAYKKVVGTAKLSTHKRDVPLGAHFALALKDEEHQ
jgi:hypothetical protein